MAENEKTEAQEEQPNPDLDTARAITCVGQIMGFLIQNTNPPDAVRVTTICLVESAVAAGVKLDDLLAEVKRCFDSRPTDEQLERDAS